MNMETEIEKARQRLRESAQDVAQAKRVVEARLSAMRERITYHLVHQTAPISALAMAAGKERNYVDRIKAKSDAAPLRGGKDNRVPKVAYGPDAMMAATEEVARAAKKYEAAKKDYAESLEARDVLMSQVYADRLLGPTQIAKEVGIDRNSVMRITRAKGIPRIRQGASA